MFNRIAVLMTCYNRKKITLECLRRLGMQKGISSYLIKVFLVDDGCTDGTGTAVRNEFPQVQVLQGDGTLFWCGGMRLAFGEALKNNFDFYLWLNDDSMLNEFAIQKMLTTYQYLLDQNNGEVIVVGSLSDTENRALSYGGSTFGSRWRPTRYKMIQPSDHPQRCDLFNGNCVLIPYQVAMTVGNMSSNFQHGPGDKDYALRASLKGISSWICAGYVGKCTKNTLLERWKNRDLSIDERVNALNHPVIIARVKDWLMFSRIYHKFLWPYFYISTQLRINFPVLYIYLKIVYDTFTTFLRTNFKYRSI